MIPDLDGVEICRKARKEAQLEHHYNRSTCACSTYRRASLIGCASLDNKPRAKKHLRSLLSIVTIASLPSPLPRSRTARRKNEISPCRWQRVAADSGTVCFTMVARKKTRGGRAAPHNFIISAASATKILTEDHTRHFGRRDTRR